MTRRWTGFARRYWIDGVWVVWVLVNGIAAVTFREWATVPFHFIWVGLTLLYGWRVWSMRATLVNLGGVVVVTTFALVDDVIQGHQPVDELTEIPLMATVFLVMVWYVRRHVAAREESRRFSEHNLALLNQQRRLIQDTSHVLRTPLTIAMGHAELMLRAGLTDASTMDDLKIVMGQLQRLKTISDRLIALAATEQPDFLHIVETSVDSLVTQAWSRWSPTSPRLRLGSVVDIVDEPLPVDPTRVADALDELISNALVHTPPGAPVTLSGWREEGWVVLAVADEGPGIPEDAQERIFERFGRADKAKPHNGLGLGLALVKAVADAHGGSITLRPAPINGTVFELRLPAVATKRPALPGPRIAASETPQLSAGRAW